MATIEQSIEVNVPVRTAYDQWTQFEEFPQFMDGVEEVRQIDDTHLHWVASVGGHHEEWDAEIVEQTPDRLVSWRATDGKPNSGTVRFEPVNVNATRIDLTLEYEHDGMVEALGAKLGADDRQVKGDLERFKEMIEARGVETGAWRGEVHAGQTTGSPTNDPGRGDAGL